MPSVWAQTVKGDGLGWEEIKGMKGEQLAQCHTALTDWSVAESCMPDLLAAELLLWGKHNARIPGFS